MTKDQGHVLGHFTATGALDLAGTGASHVPRAKEPAPLPAEATLAPEVWSEGEGPPAGTVARAQDVLSGPSTHLPDPETNKGHRTAAEATIGQVLPCPYQSLVLTPSSAGCWGRAVHSGECGPTAGPFRTSVACGVPPELLGRMQKRERNRHHAVLRLLGPAHRDTLS